MKPQFIIAFVVAAASCVHAPPVAEPSPVTAPAAQTEVVQPPAPLAVAAPLRCAGDSECRNGFLCVNQQCVAITAELPECGVVRVHFEFNESLLPAQEQVPLQRMARCLRADHALHVTIEGNADERGTEEYNLALGSKRAAGVERYLETLGASRAQLDTVSYGYERPLCQEHDEKCWAKNRRVGVKPARSP